MTSFNDVWPKFVIESRSVAVQPMSSATVLMPPRLRQFRARSVRPSSSIR